MCAFHGKDSDALLNKPHVTDMVLTPNLIPCPNEWPWQDTDWWNTKHNVVWCGDSATKLNMYH